ncbi:MAG: hypothetical protein A2V66_16925 [Ignavibacteria bacterium RBG_13_36_8]|nr:MAG: hypothetical protein A2V66_16925 [Ignavibacteria bacterium RBG_13_36_8]
MGVKLKGTGRPPFGYVYDRVQKKFFINKEQAEILKFIFKLAASTRNISSLDIVRELNRKKMKTFAGEKWSSKIVSNLFETAKLDLYAGYKDDQLGDNWEPIIDKNIADKLKGKVTIKTSKRPRKNVYLLTGISHCGNCGDRIKSSIRISPDRTFLYYICSAKTKYGSETCSSKQHHQEVIDKLVITDLLTHYTAINKIKTYTHTYEKQKNKSIDSQIHSIQKRIESLMNNQVNTTNPDKVHQLNSEMQNLLSNQKELLLDKLTPFDFASMQKELTNFSKKSVLQKKDILTRYVKKITIHEAYIEIEYYFRIDNKFNNKIKLDI